MKTIFLILIFNCLTLFRCYADKIYIMNAPGYNTAEPQLINKIINLGNTVTVENVLFTTLPSGFTSACDDSINGYDWLCFFGNFDFSPLLPQIQFFIDSGGKVFYQYEASCCTVSSSAVSTILSGLTGLSITPNANNSIAQAGNETPGWEAANMSCCINFTGNGYKGLDGVPLTNQWQASSTLNSAAPIISTCPNVGFLFTTTDFVGTSHKGAIVGLGDISVWYLNAGEPFAYGGTLPINESIVEYFFHYTIPTDGTPGPCRIFPDGCIQTYSNPTPPTVYLGDDTTLCPGTTLTLYATPDTTILSETYLWQDGSTNPTFTVTQPGTFWVKVTSANCGTIGMAADTINVSYSLMMPTVNLGNDTVLCQGGTLTLNATTPNATYLWQDNSINPTFNVMQQGLFWVKVTNNCGTTTDTINVNYNPSPTVNLGNDTILCQGENLTLNASATNATYLWQNSSTNPTFNITETGIYYVKVINNCGTNSDTLTIEFKRCNCTFYIPNSFTPNNNGGNDSFFPVFDCIFIEYNFMIFNRWGEKLFETNSATDYWDGTYKGKISPIGVYVYVITYKSEKENSKTKYGRVTLIR